MTRSLRILHCVPSLNPGDGGPARSVPALAAAEGGHGVDVRVWSRQKPTIDLSFFKSVRFISGPLDRVISKDWKPDIIHDHGLWLPSNHASARIGRHQRIPRVISPRGMLEPWCLQHRRYKKQIAWQMYQQRDLLSSACLHATSTSEANQFRKLGFRQPIVLLPNGVSLPDCEVTERAFEFGETREILFLSRIHRVKGLLNLIEAWHASQQSGWKLRIIGSDEDGHRNELLRSIAAQNLSRSVSIGDAVHSAEKWNIIQNADVLVLPSFSENFGIVVAEALAVGTPVITTTGTPWSQVQERRCGWYVEPTIAGLSQALSDAMQTRRTELDAMGRRGQQWVRQEFAWTDIGRKMLVAYDWLLGRGDIREWICDDTKTRRQAA